MRHLFAPRRARRAQPQVQSPPAWAAQDVPIRYRLARLHAIPGPVEVSPARTAAMVWRRRPILGLAAAIADLDIVPELVGPFGRPVLVGFWKVRLALWPAGGRGYKLVGRSACEFLAPSVLCSGQAEGQGNAGERPERRLGAYTAAGPRNHWGLVCPCRRKAQCDKRHGPTNLGTITKSAIGNLASPNRFQARNSACGLLPPSASRAIVRGCDFVGGAGAPLFRQCGASGCLWGLPCHSRNSCGCVRFIPLCRKGESAHESFV